MSDLSLQQFDFNGNTIKVVMVDGKPWFVAQDVCEILTVSNVSQACSRISKLDKQRFFLPTMGGDQKKLVISNDGVKKLIGRSRKPQAIELARYLGLEVLVTSKEQEYISILQASFPDQNPISQFCIHGFHLDLYLAKSNIAIECDEYGHSSYPQNREVDRERIIKGALGCSFVRFNPDEAAFNIGDVIYGVRKLIGG